MAIHKVFCVLIGLGMVLSGCRASSAVNALGATPEATFTVPVSTSDSLFDAPASQSGSMGIGISPSMDAQTGSGTTLRPLFGEPNASAAQQPAATATSAATPTAVPTTLPLGYQEAVIYGDKVDPNWSLEESSNVDYDPFDSIHWFTKLDDRHDSGAVSMAVTPLEDFGTLFFTVKPSTNVTYKRSKVLGISLWLNSGASILDTDDLALTVVGSNELSYWAPDDFSAFANSAGTFSETRLYYLGLNRAIPPGSWVQIILWLDDREFDPIYENVVGFYLKNDGGFDTTYYVDNVSLLVAP
jgi:hypothetical protein